MELVYLWVGKYKNIENQGFNFSPRFTCEFFHEYDENNELKDNCELKITPKEHINIFPPNINVTAIVGENGSGKSSILKIIKCEAIQREEKSAIYLAVFFDSGKYYYYGTIHNFKYEGLIEKQPIPSKYILNHNDLYHNMNFIKLDGTSINGLLLESFKHRYSYQENNIFIPKFIQMCKNISKQKSQFRYFNIFDTLRLILRNKEKLDKNNTTIAEALQLIEKKYSLQTQTTLREDETYEYVDIKILENGKFNSDINKFHSVQILLKKDENVKIEDNIPIFDLELINSHTHITYSSLSNGEKNYIRYITEAIFHEDGGHLPGADILLFDEAETSFHPNLQKELIKDSINLLQNEGNEKHLIFATHSPFLLSDIPKENVIFLKKDQNGNCINVTEEIDIETFGANIHTLLSHGFFMKEGLMGEFAKEKINKAIRYLNQKELSKEEIEYCENIISIVGEPILKRQLQKRLDSKRLAKIDKIDSIQKQIKALEEELKKVQK